MSDVLEVKIRRGFFSLYDRDGDFVGQVSTGSGRAHICDAFYARERTCRIVDNEDGYPSCSECGAHYLCMLDASYCPGCGARVVDE